MPIKFDKKKKTKDELVLQKRVPLRILGKNYIYLMTNDFTVILNKLKSFDCRIPEPEDFTENPSLAKNVQKKMKEIGACWSLVITSNLAVLNYLDSRKETPFIVFLERLTSNGQKISIIKLFDCIIRNKTNEIKAIVDAGYDVDQYIESGCTPLMLACSMDRKEAVRILLELGADVNVADADGRTPLMYTTVRNAVGSAKLLLAEKNIKLETKDNTGSTALLRAASKGSYEVLKLLVQAGANVNTINYSGESVLTHAIKQKNSVVSELLIQYGADINYSDKLGNTPLIEAAKNDSFIVAKKLINLGANTLAKDVNQNTAFIVAAESNSSQVLTLLIDSQEISEEEYLQAVIKAAMKGNIDTTNTLLKKSKNSAHMAFAALNSACLKNNSDIVHICMDYYCDINDTLYCGMTPLMIACYVNAEKTAAQLIAYDADINKADEDGLTALMYAASKNNLNLINLLLRNGADRDLIDKDGRTFEDYTNSYDNRSYSQLIFDRIGPKVSSSEISFQESIPKEHQSFPERFDWYMQQYWKRFPNNKQSKIYKDGGITKQHFSKIISNRKPDFRPEKDTVLKLALGLQLTLNETEDLLHSAGYAFSDKDKKDVEIKNLFSEKNYKLFDWSERIYEVTGKIFFNAVIECEEDE